MLGKSRACFGATSSPYDHRGPQRGSFRCGRLFLRPSRADYIRPRRSANWIRTRAEAPILALDALGQQALVAARADWAQATFSDLVDRPHGPTSADSNYDQPLAQKTAFGHDLSGDPLLRRLLAACEVMKLTKASAAIPREARVESASSGKVPTRPKP